MYLPKERDEAAAAKAQAKLFAVFDAFPVVDMDAEEQMYRQQNSVKNHVTRAKCNGIETAAETLDCWQNTGLFVSSRSRALAAVIDEDRKHYNYGLINLGFDNEDRCGMTNGVFFDPVLRVCMFIDDGNVFAPIAAINPNAAAAWSAEAR